MSLSYEIVRATEMPELCGCAGCGPWSTANALEISNFPWYQSGDKQATTVRMLYDDNALYVQFLCEDKHIDAKSRELNGMVCQDSCVEFFAMTNPSINGDYFNLEINCCGRVHLGLGEGRPDRTLAPQAIVDCLQIVTSVESATKDASADDDGWWVAAAIPFDVLSDYTGHPVAPGAGSQWRANCFRCGGQVDDQYGVWSPVQWDHPDYHRPEFFSLLRFA